MDICVYFCALSSISLVYMYSTPTVMKNVASSCLQSASIKPSACSSSSMAYYLGPCRFHMNSNTIFNFLHKMYSCDFFSTYVEYVSFV